MCFVGFLLCMCRQPGGTSARSAARRCMRAGGTLGALAIYGLIRMQQRAARQQQQHLAASHAETPVLSAAAPEVSAAPKSSIRFR